MTRRLPKELVGGQTQHIGLVADQAETLGKVEAALLSDVRFEYLAKRVNDVVWRFAAACYVHPGADHVRAFIEQHAREPMDLVCYVPIEYLKVSVETDLFGVSLLPVSDTRIPPIRAPFSLEFPVGCVAAVDVRGTSYACMARRARSVASQTLRVLRVALDAHTSIAHRQVRFRLGSAHAFDERLSGWSRPEDAADELPLSESLMGFVLAQPVARVPAEPDDVQRKANLALQWMERALFATEPLVALLYLFFALEALLGDKSEGLKAHGLAFRQAMLSHAVTGSFTCPDRTYFLYDQVRSGAVHGEDAPEVNWRIVHNFAGEVRNTLSEYLTFAETQNLKRRGLLLTALDEHPDRPDLVTWLRENAGAAWNVYLGAEDDANRSEGAPPN